MVRHLLKALFLLTTISLATAAPEVVASDKRLSIVTTTTMIADLVRQVGGEHVEVAALMGPGVDPHLYKATQGDVARLQRADLVFFNGLHLEGKMAEILEKLKKQRKVVAVTDSVDPKKLRTPAEFEGNPDPHIWFDVALWSEAVDSVVGALVAADPAHQDDYKLKSSSYKGRLQELDATVRKEISSIPRDGRVLITAHDAFGYFGRAYDIEVHGLQGISTATEYGLHDVTRIVNLVLSRSVKAIFVESSVPQKFVEAIREGVRAKGRDVAIGGTLYSDSMGAEGTPEATYIGMVEYNVKTITQALR